MNIVNDFDFADFLFCELLQVIKTNCSETDRCNQVTTKTQASYGCLKQTCSSSQESCSTLSNGKRVNIASVHIIILYIYIYIYIYYIYYIYIYIYIYII